MPEAVIGNPGETKISAAGSSFEIHEWCGSGPEYLHAHYRDDEAWHILEGRLLFRIGDRTVEAQAGTTIFVPAGVPHAYADPEGTARYLIILTPRLSQLIAALHGAPRARHNELLRQFDSEILE